MRSNHIFYLLLILSFLVSCNEEPLLKEINVPENISSGDLYSQADKYTITPIRHIQELLLFPKIEIKQILV